MVGPSCSPASFDGVAGNVVGPDGEITPTEARSASLLSSPQAGHPEAAKPQMSYGVAQPLPPPRLRRTPLHDNGGSFSAPRPRHTTAVISPAS